MPHRTVSYFTLLVMVLACHGEVIAQIRGRVTSAACPYKCSSIGLAKENCREWNVGNRCFVEDLKRIDPNSLNSSAPFTQLNSSRAKPKTALSPETKRRQEIEACHVVKPYYLVKPKIVIYSTKQPSTLFASKFEVSGAVQGNCLQQALFFENGEKKFSIPIETSRSFKRFRFKFVVDESLKPEIRVVTLGGDRTTLALKKQESKAAPKAKQ